jgi:hypothetical protein
MRASSSIICDRNVLPSVSVASIKRSQCRIENMRHCEKVEKHGNPCASAQLPPQSCGR